MAEITGGCLCGAVRYTASRDPVLVAHCHCDDCRRATGSGFATNVFFRDEDMTVLQGATKSYRHTADSGNIMIKEFCPDCGSQLFGSSSGRPGVKAVKVGSIDDARAIEPQVEVFVSRALPFSRLSETAEKFERGRPPSK